MSQSRVGAAALAADLTAFFPRKRRKPNFAARCATLAVELRQRRQLREARVRNDLRRRHRVNVEIKRLRSEAAA